jgi:hypothetical protein
MDLDLVKGLARGLTADVAGAPVDLMSQIANLGLAAGGYVGHKTGLLKQPWDLIEQPVGGSDWFAKNTVLQDPGTAAYTAGRLTGNVAPLAVNLAGKLPLMRDSTLGANRFIEDHGPSGWLEKKRLSILAEGLRANGSPKSFGPTTTVFDGQVEMPLHRLRHIPGLMDEQRNVRPDSLEWLLEYMKRTGRLPSISDTGKEYAPFIQIGANGRAFVNEGNHRIMAADKLGWESMPTQVQYHAGGETVASPIWQPQYLLDKEKELLKIPLEIRRKLGK